ncbi:hypothetical protein EJD97_019217 [Solanum chilense]|uniref:Uncharacterized protein n=1 Tax=Solanum chilense TaxID=4083 RepID=A0A6N2AFK5_SOLCI|nr:hypothetical protein EJD97_019217 [Solanum chilense]
MEDYHLSRGQEYLATIKELLRRWQQWWFIGYDFIYWFNNCALINCPAKLMKRNSIRLDRPGDKCPR